MKRRNAPGCPCCASGNTLRMTVQGCNNLVLAGATVAATLSGTTYTGTTDSLGVADVAIGGTGTYSVAVTYTPAARFATSTGNVVVSAPGITTATRTLSAATGYTCQDWEAPGGTGNRDCVLPLANTLFLTDPTYGAVTLTYNGVNSWGGTKSVSYGACGICPAGTVSLDYGLPRTASAGNVLGFSYGVDTSGCPSNLGIGGRQSLSGLGFLAANTLACPPSLLATFTYNATSTDKTRCSGTHIFTLTE